MLSFVITFDYINLLWKVHVFLLIFAWRMLIFKFNLLTYIIIYNSYKVYKYKVHIIQLYRIHFQNSTCTSFHVSWFINFYVHSFLTIFTVNKFSIIITRILNFDFPEQSYDVDKCITLLTYIFPQKLLSCKYEFGDY